MSISKIISIIVVIFGFFTVTETFFTVHETEQILIERFGQLRENISEAGIYSKVPFVDNLISIDKRVLNFQSDKIKVYLAEKKQLDVDAFARFKITDPIKFYQAARTIYDAEGKISTILESATRTAFGQKTLGNILSNERQDLMYNIKDLANKQTKDIGIEVIDVRVLRAELPPENSENVYKNMISERNERAKQLRAEGKEKALEITAKADRESEIIKAEARKEAEILRGEGDAIKNQIFAQSYGRDKAFFDFYRTMISYERSFNSKNSNTSVILSTDDGYLGKMNNGR